MTTPQNFTFAHGAALGGAGVSTRAAVNEIFKSTDMFLAAFRTELLTKAHARQVEAQDYMKNLRQTVQTMMSEFQHARQDASDGIRTRLKDYVADLQASVVKAKRDADAELSKVAARRRKSAPKLARQRAAAHKSLVESERRHLEELASGRQRATQSLRDELHTFAGDLHRGVAQIRDDLRHEFGSGEEAPARAKFRTAPAEQAPQEKPGKSNGAHFTMGAQSPASEVEKPSKAKKTAEAAKGASSAKRNAH